MKSGASWSIRGIDDDLRDAAVEAARQSGLSVSEWLNQTIAERAAEEGISPQRRQAAAVEDKDDELSAVADSVAELTRRIRAMDANARSAISGLKDRLDEIEHNLGRAHDAPSRDERRARSLRGVTAMVGELARELDDADESARSMIEGLRGRKAGGEPAADRVGDAIRSLDQRIAAMAEQMKAPSPTTRPEKLDALRDRLDALLARPAEQSRSPSPDRAASLDATLKSLEARIDQARARLVTRDVAGPGAAPPLSGEEEERMGRIRTRLADIAGRLGDQPPREQPPPPDDLDSAIAEIASRRQRPEDREDNVRRYEKAVEEAVASLRADMAGLAGQLSERRPEPVGQDISGLARRVEALGAEKPVDRALLAGIRSEIEALRAITEGTAREDVMVQRLAEIAESLPERSRLDALDGEIAALRRALESADGPRAMARLEMRVSELARSVEAALHSRQTAVDASAAGIAAGLADIRGAIEDLDAASRRTDPSSVGRLETRLDEIAARIDGLLDRAAPADVVNSLHDRLEALVDRLDRMSKNPPRPVALDELKDEIVAIRSEISGRPQPKVDHLEEQIRDLASRLDTVARPDSDAAQLAELEAQVAHIAGELERSLPRTVALEQVEENLVRLQAHLSENRKDSIEAARLAARDAVREFAGKEADSGLLRALKQDLDHIRDAAGDADQRTQETLGSLHGSLATVVERLARLEDEATEPARVAQPGGSTVTSDAEAGMPRGGPAPRTAPEARPPGSRPLEPGSGKPDLEALRKLAERGKEPSDPRSAGDRRADFIAAARRAAQAAVAETGAVKEEQPGSDRPSAFARIGQAIRNRRKPLLLAAAAIVLALGAWHLYGPAIIGSDEQVVTAKVQPATETDSAAAKSKTRALIAEGTPVPPKPRASAPALVAPPADGQTVIAFASPEAVGGRFGAAFDAPATDGFAAAAGDDPASEGTAGAAPPGPDEAAAPVAVAAIGSDKLRAAVAAGEPTAFFEVATRYAEGRGVTQDLAQAAEWYRRSAEAGVAVAQYRLGSLYERGQGVPKDPAAAVDWYQRAADQGNVGAMHNLAVMMSEGVDGQPDQQKALEWFLAAGNYGVKDSQYNLGVIYARGLGPEQDLVEAYKWFALSAAQGDADAASRRDEVAKMLSPDELAKARATVQAWHAKPTLQEPNGIAVPEGGWDSTSDGVSEADRRELVKKIQTLLAEQGYDPGPPDGVDGPKTRDAVRAFQRTVGITETGQIDRKLITALADQQG